MKNVKTFLVCFFLLAMFSGVAAAVDYTQINIPTYDGSGHATHPDVYYNESGVYGYKYWMAMTPYYGSNDSFENPSLIASNDGINWVVPVGITNPLDPKPAIYGPSEHNSDTDLVYDNITDKFLIYYRWNNLTTQSIVMRTYDGSTVSDEIPISVSHTESVVSHSVILNTDGTYDMWGVDIGATPNTVYKQVSTDGVTFTDKETVVVNCDNTTQEIWHMDVIKYGEVYYGLFSYSDKVGNTNNTLRMGTSTDGGDTFTVQDTPVIVPGIDVWDDSSIYRSTGIMDSNGMRVWYSAHGKPITGSFMVWGIGVTRIAATNGFWEMVDYTGDADTVNSYMEYQMTNVSSVGQAYDAGTVSNITLAVAPVYSSTPYTVNTDGLAAWYKFDANTGTNISDSSGNGLHAVGEGDFSWYTNGKYNSSGRIVSAGGIGSKQNFNLSSSNFSIHMFITQMNDTGTEASGYIGQGVGTNGWMLGMYKHRLIASINGSSDGKYVYGPNVKAGENYGIGVTYQYISENRSKITIYLDGKETEFGYTNSTYSPIASALRLGRSDITGYTKSNITLDNVVIYNRTLNASEMSDLYYDPVASMQFHTNSNSSLSAVVNGADIVYVPFDNEDGAIESIVAYIPDETVINGVTIRDYSKTISPSLMSTMIVSGENQSGGIYAANISYTPGADGIVNLNYTTPLMIADAIGLVSISSDRDILPTVGYTPDSKEFSVLTGSLTHDSTYTYRVQAEYANTPIAGLTVNRNTGDAPVSVQFTDTSTGIPTAWLWDFGDNTTSTVQNPSHVYSEAGLYTVVLTVSNAAGNSTETKTGYINIAVNPYADMKTEASGIWSGGVGILMVVIIVMLSLAIVGLLQGKSITPANITELVIGLMIVMLIVTVGYGTLSSISGTI